MNMQNIEDAIIKYMEVYDRPITANDIVHELNMSRSAVFRHLSQMVEKGVLTVLTGSPDNVGDYNRRIKYYTLSKSEEEIDKDKEFLKLYQTVNNIKDEIYEQKDKIAEEKEEIFKKINNTETDVKNIYANIISIMSIFVAIFSLIIINTTAIYNGVLKVDSVCEIFKRLLILNIPLVVSIIVLLLAVKLILLRKSK